MINWLIDCAPTQHGQEKTFNDYENVYHCPQYVNNAQWHIQYLKTIENNEKDWTKN